VVGELESGFEAVSEEETTKVEVLRALDELLDLGLVEVRGGEGLGSGEVGAEGTVRSSAPNDQSLAAAKRYSERERSRDEPVVASDDNSASTGRLVLDDLVSRVKTLLLVGSTELVRERVGTDGTEVGGRVVGKDVLSSKEGWWKRGEERKTKKTDLGTTSGVLGSSTGDVVDLVVLLEVLVAVRYIPYLHQLFSLQKAGSKEEKKEDGNAHLVLLALSEDSVVGLEVVLLEEGRLVDDLDVEEGVAHGEEEDVLGSGHDEDCRGMRG
jgi:hypothetical protein